MYKQNLHTHTTYCDGNNTPEEMVLGAIEKGFGSLGFSMHSHIYSKEKPVELVLAYKEEIARLKKAYADQIEIYCGIEREMRDVRDFGEFDYQIGAVHYFRIDEKWVDFDRDAVRVQSVIDEHFGGDGLAYARAYYQEVARLPEFGKFDIIAHFDIITKHKENVQLFDANAKAYQTYAIEAAEALAGKIPFFEINTGAIARGYRTTPYPDVFLIKELKRLGFGAVISTDCHDKTKLDLGYAEAVELLKQCGFKERFILTKNGFVGIEL